MLILAAALSLLQTQYSDAFVLSMTHEKWVNWYADHVGGSTADMSEASQRYGLALRHRADNLLAKSTPANREFAKAIRPLAQRYYTSGVDVAYAFSGGGTIWVPVYASRDADVEQMIITVVSGKQTKARVVSDVTKALDSLAKDAASQKADLDISAASGGGYQAVVTSLKEMRSALGQMIELIKKRPRRDSDAVLNFCLETAGIPETDRGG